MNMESVVLAMKKGIEDGNRLMNDQLGNEPGYRRLAADEQVHEGDESFGIWGQRWTPASSCQINLSAHKVGGFAIWRRPLTR